MAPPCFLAGTRIVTLRGEVPAEDVTTADLVMTLSGEGAPLKPVAWTGRIALDPATDPDRLAPVRLAAGAIEPGMPFRDLRVSPDHAIALEDAHGERVLVAAGDLVNGASITREPIDGPITYVHIATDGHELLMADGMAAESLPPGSDRAPFEPNRVIPLRGPPVPLDFAPASREGTSVLPLAYGPAARALHARLRAVAEEAGWTLTEDPALTATTGAGPAELLTDADGDYVFLLPPDCDEVRLDSRRFTPADTDPAGGDRRVLGVALAEILHDGDPVDADGLLPEEGSVTRRWRWTTGAVTLRLAPRPHETTLELRLVPGLARYWLPPTPR